MRAVRERKRDSAQPQSIDRAYSADPIRSRRERGTIAPFILNSVRSLAQPERWVLICEQEGIASDSVYPVIYPHN